ncbi:MAG: flagellar basal body L-ring protein FlgH [Myxococcales bacterium]|nr:flagellar basal body L-ring protein FlgH [Myxococcales bacterium]MCZ6714102.1 flagellar basal body L-ring protein FlgH [Deltaproteobacteria bacterium]
MSMLWLLLLVGCAELHPPSIYGEPPLLPQPPAPTADVYVPAEGSLWRGDASRRFLAFENRAKRVGDLITVEIQEQAMAENEATTELTRDSKYEATLNSDVALQTLVTRPIRNILGFLGFTDQKTDKDPTEELSIVEARTKSEFDGEGIMKREARFTTTVACLVTEITPSGLMRIEGERHLRINNETEVIRITGFIRPEDIAIDNTIASVLIASADIHYGGVGLNAEQQEAPWLARLFWKLLPF